MHLNVSFMHDELHEKRLANRYFHVNNQQEIHPYYFQVRWLLAVFSLYQQDER